MFKESQSWKDRLTQREVIRNNYRVTGSIKRAKDFVATVRYFKTQRNTDVIAKPITSAVAISLKRLLRYARNDVNFIRSNEVRWSSQSPY
jgi:hypothetical protein